MTESNVILEINPDDPLRSALLIPGGRDKYIDHMLLLDKAAAQEADFVSDGYTLGENMELYGLMFDEYQATEMWRSGTISRSVLNLINLGAGQKKIEINGERHKRLEALRHSK